MEIRAGRAAFAPAENSMNVDRQMNRGWIGLLLFLLGMAVADSPPSRSTQAGEPPSLMSGSTAPRPADPDDEPMTIDLSSALRLAGVRNLEIVVAQQRVEATVAGQQLAAAQILPNLNAGSNFDAHTGELLTSTGALLAVNRSALYVGAGAIAVGSSPPQAPGLQYNLNVSTAIFNYLVSRQNTNRARFDRQAVDNAVLLNVAVGYAELLRAAGAVRLALLTRNDTAEVARLTADHAKAGQGRQADANRAATELRQREQDVAED